MLADMDQFVGGLRGSAEEMGMRQRYPGMRGMRPPPPGGAMHYPNMQYQQMDQFQLQQQQLQQQHMQAGFGDVRHQVRILSGVM